MTIKSKTAHKHRVLTPLGEGRVVRAGSWTVWEFGRGRPSPWLLVELTDGRRVKFRAANVALKENGQ